MPSGEVPTVVTVPRSDLKRLLLGAVRLGDTALCVTLSNLLDSTPGDRVRVELADGVARPAAPPSIDAPASGKGPDAGRNDWEEWVSLRDALDALVRDKARGYSGAARCDDPIAAARADMDAFVRRLVEPGFRPTATARADEVPLDRLCVMRRTMAMPTPAMMRARLERDGWEREALAVDGVALYTRTPPGFETEFRLAMPDEATASNGWKSHVEQALRTLAGLEGRAVGDARDRPIGDLAAEIVAAARSAGDEGPGRPGPATADGNPHAGGAR